jgi:hypothetical protein
MVAMTGKPEAKATRPRSDNCGARWAWENLILPSIQQQKKKKKRREIYYFCYYYFL